MTNQQRILDETTCMEYGQSVRHCTCIRCTLWRIEIATKEQEKAETNRANSGWFRRLLGMR